MEVIPRTDNFARYVAERVRRREDDGGLVRPAHAPLRDHRDRKRKLAVQEQVVDRTVDYERVGPGSPKKNSFTQCSERHASLNIGCRRFFHVPKHSSRPLPTQKPSSLEVSFGCLLTAYLARHSSKSYNTVLIETPVATMKQKQNLCRILSLDGGGAKAFYTLGILREIEQLLPRPIHETFDLIFGTSTGSIIAALLSIGRTVNEIHELYKEHVPTIMRAKCRSSKSEKLRETSEKVFGQLKFDSVLTGLGIVATNWQLNTPMIFKSRYIQAHGRRATFVAGFGCTIADAVEASCSAFPFFERKIVTTSNGDVVELVDGGYCANNPTLYALVDATAALGYMPMNCRVLSLGCGQYPDLQRGFIARMRQNFVPLQLIQKTLEVNTASMDQLRRLLYADVQTVRISDTFEKSEMATNLFEYSLIKLNLLRQQGTNSFALYERDVRKLLLDEG